MQGPRRPLELLLPTWSRTSNQPVDVLRISFPAVLVTYLVSEGIENYQAGSYWPNLTVPGLQPLALGPAFERAIESLGLEDFDHLAEDGALRFVAPILAHGGVPKYSVDDFFRLLLGEVRRYGNAEAADLVAIWRARKTAFQEHRCSCPAVLAVWRRHCDGLS
jgi:hypothetical protein